MVVKNDVFVFDVHFTAMLFELIAFILVFLIAIAVFIKWRTRRTVATLYLAIALFSISFAAFFVFTDSLAGLVLGSQEDLPQP